MNAAHDQDIDHDHMDNLSLPWYQI
jgi:hypothetical protein